MVPQLHLGDFESKLDGQILFDDTAIAVASTVESGWFVGPYTTRTVSKIYSDFTLSQVIDLFALLTQMQDEAHISHITFGHIMFRILPGQILQDIFQEYTETLGNPLFDLNFFPRFPDTEQRKQILRWSCLPRTERIRDFHSGGELSKAIQSWFFKISWHRVLSEAIYEEDPRYFDLTFKYGPEACYSSGLVKTRMANLVPEIPLMADLVPEGEENYIPVIRYSKGSHGSLFYGSSAEGYCGTFYYYEPDSEIVLRYQRKLEAENKVQAGILLRTEIKEKYPDKAWAIAVLNKGLVNVTNALQRKTVQLEKFDPEISRGEAYKYLRYYIQGGHHVNRLPGAVKEFLDQNAHTILYALEDPLDQPLCTVAGELGYDTVLLTNMAGSSRMVTEVLDVRSRGESLENLFRLD